MRNVEIKARIRDYKHVCLTGEVLSSNRGGPDILKQDDTFYNVNQGRLKMRNYPDSSATLVRYDRPDKGGPKLSNYELLKFLPGESEKAKLLDEMLKKCLGVRGRVIKERKLYIIGQTRLHIDTVEGLGQFLELEVVLHQDQTVEQGQAIAQELMEKLHVKEEDLIDCAYMDLLQANNVGGSPEVLQNKNDRDVLDNLLVENKTDEEKAEKDKQETKKEVEEAKNYEKKER